MLCYNLKIFQGERQFLLEELVKIFHFNTSALLWWIGGSLLNIQYEIIRDIISLDSLVSWYFLIHEEKSWRGY